MLCSIREIDYAVAHRRFHIDREIDEELAATVVEILLRAEELSPKEDFTIYLNTEGGTVSSAFAIANILRTMPYNVTCHCLGEVASAGIFILASCDTRMAGPDTHFLWHGIYWAPESESPEGLLSDAEHLKKYERMGIKRLKEWTCNPDIFNFLGNKRWFNVKEAKKVNLLNA